MGRVEYLRETNDLIEEEQGHRPYPDDPLCSSCGNPATNYWFENEFNLFLCDPCTSRICGGLLVDLVLAGVTDEDAIESNIHKRAKWTRRHRERVRQLHTAHIENEALFRGDGPSAPLIARCKADPSYRVAEHPSAVDCPDCLGFLEQDAKVMIFLRTTEAES